MSIGALVLVCVAGLNTAIGLYVYRRNPRAAPNRAFALMVIPVALWTSALVIRHYALTENVWSLRLVVAAASLIPIGVLAFVEETPLPFGDRWQLRRRVFTPVAIGCFAAAFSPWLVVSTTPGPAAVWGPLFPVFAIFVVVCLAYAVCVLALRYQAATGLTRQQLRYLVPVFATSMGLVTATNLIVPVVFETSEPSKYGPLFTLPPLALIAHSMLRHHLLELRVVVKKSAVYLAAAATASLVLVALLSSSNALFGEQQGVSLRETLLALSVAILFGPLKSRIQRVFDRYLYREPYDYARTIREASRALRGTIDLTALLGHVTAVVDRTLKPERAAVYLFDDEARVFRLVPTGADARFPDTLAAPASLVSQLLHEREPLFRDEGAASTRGERTALAVAFAQLGADVIVPLVENREVIGLLCLGARRSGDPYSSADADLLATLANQSAVAIKNAQTHERVVQLYQELQAIVGTLDSGVVAVSARGQIGLFNRAAERLTGVPATAARGRQLGDLPVPLATSLADTLRDGAPRSPVEFSLPDAGGQPLSIVASTSPLRDPAGQLVGAVAVITDMSPLKALEREKRRAERLASIEAIASGLVHEIRNPLVAIKTFCQLLPTRYQDPEFRETLSRVANHELLRIEAMLSRFGGLASASSQPMEAIDLGEPLRATLALLGPQLDNRRIRVHVVADGRPRPILGNVAQLEQLFLNLCLNAMEAMTGGGELTVRVSELTDGMLGAVLVEVADTGVGIPDDLLARIFTPFTTTKRRGSGLGLAICRAIADAHRARIAVRSNNGQRGSTFTVEFPIHAPGTAGGA